MMPQREDINLITSAVCCVVVFCLLGVMVGTAVIAENTPGTFASLILTAIGMGSFHDIFKHVRFRALVVLITASLISFICGIYMQLRS
jgi:hypothetical protein